MFKRRIILATLTLLLILSGVVAFKLWAAPEQKEEILPGDAPTAVATAEPAEVTPGAEVSFDGSESYDKDIKATWVEINGNKYDYVEVKIDGVVDKDKYEWKFGDGNSGSGATTTHTYEQGREEPYEVELTITADHEETATATVEVTVGPGIRLTANPQSITSGNQTTLTATVVGNDGNTDTNFNGSVDFSCNPADRLELSATSAPASGGVATITATGRKVGEVTITASAEGLISDTADVTVKGKLEKVSGDNQQGAPGKALPQPLRVKVADSQGNGVGNVSIAFSMASQPQGANASRSPASATTGSDGCAETTLTLGSKPGEYKVKATGTNTEPESKIFTAKAIANLTKASGDGQSGAPRATLPNPLKVRVEDNEGNGISGVGITFAVGTWWQSLMGARVNPESDTTNEEGYAETTLTMGRVRGAYSVVATGTNTTPTSVTFSATATGAIGQLVITKPVDGSTYLNLGTSPVKTPTIPFAAEVRSGGQAVSDQPPISWDEVELRWTGTHRSYSISIGSVSNLTLEKGGSLSMKATCTYQGENLEATKTVTVKGTNPTQRQIFGIANDIEEKAVCWKESSHRQFAAARYTGIGMPLPCYAHDGGYGLMMPTPASIEEIWNWNTNLANGVRYLNRLHGQAQTYLNTWYDPETWSWDPRDPAKAHLVWDDAFARYGPKGGSGYVSLYSPSGHGGIINPVLTTMIAYSSAVRAIIKQPPW